MRVSARRRGEEGFTHEVDLGDGHKLVLDEPAEAGGADLGPKPTLLLAASLAGCTAITLELYAERKGWDLGQVEVDVDVEFERSKPLGFDVTIGLGAELDAEQEARLLTIAGKCPVHQVLTAETSVRVSDRIERL